MIILLILLIVLALASAGGGYLGYSKWGWYGYSPVGFFLVLVLVVLLFGRF